MNRDEELPDYLDSVNTRRWQIIRGEAPASWSNDVCLPWNLIFTDHGKWEFHYGVMAHFKITDDILELDRDIGFVV
jgi:hypothetical protein